MKKLLLAFTTVLFLSGNLTAQTYAPDFTANDCAGNSHTLSHELSQGRVVVLVWVMPCSTCINDAKGAYDAAKSLETTHPGRVVYWMIDDFGNTSCSSLTNWASNLDIKTNVTFFRNEKTNNALPIDEEKFGGTGMPHVAVVGPDSKIYFNVRNGKNNRTAIEDAISTAILKTSVSDIYVRTSEIEIYPNPAKQNLAVDLKSEPASALNYEIYNALGEKLISASEYKSMGNQVVNIDINTLTNGIYFLKLTADNRNYITKFIVAK